MLTSSHPVCLCPCCTHNSSWSLVAHFARNSETRLQARLSRKRCASECSSWWLQTICGPHRADRLQSHAQIKDRMVMLSDVPLETAGPQHHGRGIRWRGQVTVDRIWCGKPTTCSCRTRRTLLSMWRSESHTWLVNLHWRFFRRRWFGRDRDWQGHQWCRSHRNSGLGWTRKATVHSGAAIPRDVLQHEALVEGGTE